MNFSGETSDNENNNIATVCWESDYLKIEMVHWPEYLIWNKI